MSSSCKACTFSPLDTQHAARSMQHKAQSTQHKARLNLNVRYIQRFVPGFLLFIVPLKSRNIPIQFLCQSSQYFQIQLTNYTTMKSVIAASLLASAAAFAPAKVAQSSAALKAADFEDALGVQEPLGLWDPMGLLNGADEERFERLRYVEIKHGRISMLAFLGQIVTRAGIHLPGSINYAGDSFDSFPNGIAALVGPNSIPTAGLVQLIAFVGLLECSVMRDIEGTGNEFVGDFRNGYIDFGWDEFDEEEKLFKRGVELNNGRAAMLGILGLMVHEEIIPLGYDADLPIIGHLV